MSDRLRCHRIRAKSFTSVNSFSLNLSRLSDAPKRGCIEMKISMQPLFYIFSVSGKCGECFCRYYQIYLYC